MDICILINTCKKNFANVDSLIESIEAYSFSKENVIIVSGQEDEPSIGEYKGVRCIKVKYTGIHLTSLIYISEHIDLYSKFQYWVLLPDTIRFGDTFFQKLMYYYTLHLKGKEVHSLPFINVSLRRPTMDMGIVHTHHIVNMKNYLDKIKTYTITYMNLIRLKLQLINNENIILGLQAVNPNIATQFMFVNRLPVVDTYITNSKDDIIETLIDNGETNQVYFSLLDLYKYQKNFKGFDNIVVSI